MKILVAAASDRANMVFPFSDFTLPRIETMPTPVAQLSSITISVSDVFESLVSQTKHQVVTHNFLLCRDFR